MVINELDLSVSFNCHNASFEMSNSLQGSSSGRDTFLVTILLVTLAVSRQVVGVNQPCDSTTNCVRLIFVNINNFSTVTSLLSRDNVSRVDQLNVTRSPQLTLKREDFDHPALRELQVLDLERNNITSLDPKLFGVLETHEPYETFDDVTALIADTFAGLKTSSEVAIKETSAQSTTVATLTAVTTTELSLKENHTEPTSTAHEEEPVLDTTTELPEANNTETSTIQKEADPLADTNTAPIAVTTTELSLKENHTEPTSTAHDEVPVLDTVTELPEANNTETSTIQKEVDPLADTTTVIPVKENSTEPISTKEVISDIITELSMDSTTETASTAPDLPMQADQPPTDSNTVVKKLNNLTSLNLRGNKLNTIEPNSFEGSPILSILILSENNIHVIEEHMFKDLVHLSKLDLSANTIYNIDAKSFQTNSNLQTLVLAGNSLLELSSDLFEHNVELKLLDLSYNHIENILNFPLSINSLQTLNMKYCKIKTIPGHHFSNLPNLRLLNLRGNNLERIETGLFTSAPNLRMILLDDNSFKSLSVDSFQEFYPILREVSRNGEGLLEDSYGVYMYEGNPWDCTTRDMIALRLWFRNKPIPSFDRIFKCRISGTVVNRVTNVVQPISNIFGRIGK